MPRLLSHCCNISKDAKEREQDRKEEEERRENRSDEVRRTGEKAYRLSFTVPSATRRERETVTVITFQSALHADTLTLIKQYLDTVD